MKDNDLLCCKGDEIDNAVYHAICALSPGEPPKWNMTIIADATLAIERIMLSHNLQTCHPWQDDEENICYSVTEDRCEHCQRGQDMSLSM